jgi:hypothetical protein
MSQAIKELTASLKQVTELFHSCIADGNGELDGDKEAIEHARALVKRYDYQKKQRPELDEDICIMLMSFFL